MACKAAICNLNLRECFSDAPTCPIESLQAAVIIAFASCWNVSEQDLSFAFAYMLINTRRTT